MTPLARGPVRLVLVALLLASCSIPLGKAPASDPAAGAPRDAEGIAACRRECTYRHDVCLDSYAASRSAGRQFDAASACDRSLGGCLDRCRGPG